MDSIAPTLANFGHFFIVIVILLPVLSPWKFSSLPAFITNRLSSSLMNGTSTTNNMRSASLSLKKPEQYHHKRNISHASALMGFLVGFFAALMVNAAKVLSVLQQQQQQQQQRESTNPFCNLLIAVFTVAPGLLPLALLSCLRYVVRASCGYSTASASASPTTGAAAATATATKGNTTHTEYLVNLAEHRYVLGLLISLLVNWIASRIIMNESLWDDQPQMGIFGIFIVWYAGRDQVLTEKANKQQQEQQKQQQKQQSTTTTTAHHHNNHHQV